MHMHMHIHVHNEGLLISLSLSLIFCRSSVLERARMLSTTAKLFTTRNVGSASTWSLLPKFCIHDSSRITNKYQIHYMFHADSIHIYTWHPNRSIYSTKIHKYICTYLEIVKVESGELDVRILVFEFGGDFLERLFHELGWLRPRRHELQNHLQFIFIQQSINSFEFKQDLFFIRSRLFGEIVYILDRHITYHVIPERIYQLLPWIDGHHDRVWSTYIKYVLIPYLAKEITISQ